MKTDDIQCEASKDGYNSSIILWRNGFGRLIFDYMKRFHTQITNQIVRFDHYLEYIIKNSQFVQDEFVGKVLDYNTYCKGKDDLPDVAAIIAFPRHPKPNDCKEKWVEKHWI